VALWQFNVIVTTKLTENFEKWPKFDKFGGFLLCSHGMACTAKDNPEFLMQIQDRDGQNCYHTILSCTNDLTLRSGELGGSLLVSDAY